MNTEKNSIDMNTEKNSIDINIETNSININTEKDSKGKQNAFFNLLFSIKSRISENRLAQRFAIISRPVNLITIVSIAPFFLGFYYFINQNQQFKKTLFQKNIPTFGIPTESLNWETFRYFSETKKDFLLGIEKVQWSRNSLFLTKKINTELFDQEYFIAIFTSSHKNEKFLSTSLDEKNEPLNSIRISSLRESEAIPDKNEKLLSEGIPDENEKFLLTDTQIRGSKRFSLISQLKKPALPLIQTFYLNLDEVPLKLDNLNSYDMFARVNKNKSVLPIDEESSPRTQIFPFNETFWTQNQNSKEPIQKRNFQDLLVESETLEEQLPAVTELNTNEVSKEMLSNSSFIEKQTSWFLEKALKNCQAFSISIFPPSDDIQTLEGVLSELEEILLEHNISPFFRRMSGYSYPDMNSQQVSSFLLHNLVCSLPKNLGLVNTTQNNLKIIFPANPTFLKQFCFSNPQIPTKMKVKAGMSRVKNGDNNKIVYNDISVFVDLNNGLDWELEETENAGKENLRFWFENYLSPINPLTHSKDTIKGRSFPSKHFLVSSAGDFTLVPFFTENQWKQMYNENKISQVFIDDHTVDDNVLPVIEASLLNSKYKYAHLNFDINSTVDHLYSPEIFTTKIKPLSSLDGEIYNDTSRPIHYKKIFSIFDSKNDSSSQNFIDSVSKNENGINFVFWNGKGIKPQILEKTFSESWEPLTFRSWLIVSQIGLAILFFNFLKSIMSDYFNELIGFIIDFGISTGIFDENIKQQIELVTGKGDKGFRIIPKSEKKFQHVAGLKPLLPEISEIVWLLKNSGNEFSLSKNIPRGLLLLGPPGTGKTLLVQAIAGEAKVPLVVVSGGSLISPGESGAVKLEFLFQEARLLAPCIVFIDEIDSIALKRPDVMENPMGGDEVLSTLDSSLNLLNLGTPGDDPRASESYDFISGFETSFFKKTEKIESLTTNSKQFREDPTSTHGMKKALEIQQKKQTQNKFQAEQLALLVQLLVELDGLHGRKGVVIIGATNAPEILDPALLRPGRFDKILEVGLPSYEKRLEILKLYAQRVQYESNISWEFFSKRTVGYSPADIASIMNESCLNAIVVQSCLTTEKKPIHTLQTIECAIDRITTAGVEKPSKKVANLFLNRVAYYQAGKVVLSTILEHHPSTLVSYLWPRRPNIRTLRLLTNLQKYFFQFARRCEIEHRIVGCYGGKAAEILFLQNSPVNFSSFGLEDLSFGFVLVCFSVEKWYLYSKSTLISQLIQLISNKNSKQFSPDKMDIFKELAYSMELPPHLLYSHETDILTPFSQNFFSSAWWQFHISQQLEFVERNFADWYRLYLPNPQETELNIEWSPPDEFYQRNLWNKKVSENSSITWNDLHNVARDYQVHALVLHSFNKALSLVDQNREYLDKIVFELLKKQVLNESEIENLASSFLPVTNQKVEKSSIQDTGTIKILNNSFGQMSRRKIKNWIDFKDFEN